MVVASIRRMPFYAQVAMQIKTFAANYAGKQALFVTRSFCPAAAQISSFERFTAWILTAAAEISCPQGPCERAPDPVASVDIPATLAQLGPLC